MGPLDQSKVSRRQVIKALSGLGVSSAGLHRLGSAAAAGPSGGRAMRRGQTATIKRGGVLRIAVTEDTDNIDPAKGGNLGFGIMGPLLGQPLVGGDPSDEIVPVLAEQFSTPDNGKTWIFNLRQGVRFHNGAELTADVVKWNYDRFIDEKNGAQVGPQFRAMGVRSSVVDKFTFQVELTSGFGSFLSQLTQNSWTCILAPESFKADGTIDKPIGTGPFVFDSYKPGAELNFTRFDAYWQQGEDGQPLPYVDGLAIKIVPEATVRLSALRAEDVDLITHTPVEDAKSWIDGAPPAGIAFTRYFYNYSDCFALNSRRAPFDNQLARQAVSYAIDRSQLNETVFSGLAEEHNQPFKLSSIWHLDVPYPAPDLDKAKALMSEAGIGGGVDVTYNAWVPEYLTIAEVIQAQLAQIGFRVTLDQHDFASWWDKSETYDYDMIEWPFGTLFHPDQAYQYLGSTHAVQWLTGGLNDPEIDAMLKEGRDTFDRDAAKALYTKLIDRMQTNANLHFLTNPALIHSFRDYVKGYQPIDQGLFALAATNGVHKAWLDK